MRHLFNRAGTLPLLAILLFAASLVAQQSKPLADLETTSAGVLKILPINHASLLLDFAGVTIYVDPVGQGTYPIPKADLILVTDIHGDHLNANFVKSLLKEGSATQIIAPAEVQKTLTDAKIIKEGDPKVLRLDGKEIGIEAVPAYNLSRGPSSGQLYHPKGRGVGYILTMGGKRIYISGDTECTPEIKQLKNIDFAFLCMNLPYTQTPGEAAECVKAFRPRVVYPYHYRGQDLQIFSDALKGENGIEVRLRNWY